MTEAWTLRFMLGLGGCNGCNRGTGRQALGPWVWARVQIFELQYGPKQDISTSVLHGLPDIPTAHPTASAAF